jgi:hypothetical protein
MEILVSTVIVVNKKMCTKQLLEFDAVQDGHYSESMSYFV